MISLTLCFPDFHRELSIQYVYELIYLFKVEGSE
jgi:hypothetical protein